MYSIIRPLLFCLEAEKAHKLSLIALKHVPSFLFPKPHGHSVTAMGLRFNHPIGLAAGMDKNGEYIDALSKLGFSFIEVGTVTPQPQKGNPKPRLFRLPQAQAIINRMGFNNHGVDALLGNIQKANYRGVLGINIGKNTDTSLEHAADDYVHCLRKVYPYASYITINISSPNSPGLRLLQEGNYFHQLLTQLMEEQKRLSDKYQRSVPLVIKLSPDESDETLKHMAELILQLGVSGIIATNTTANPISGLSTLPHGNEKGGISGRPLATRALTCLQTLKSIVGNEVALIAAGGIENAETAYQRMQAGASLLQVYTGLIYQGPKLVRNLAKGLT